MLRTFLPKLDGEQNSIYSRGFLTFHKDDDGCLYEIRRCVMIISESTLHQSSNVVVT